MKCSKKMLKENTRYPCIKIGTILQLLFILSSIQGKKSKYWPLVIVFPMMPSNIIYTK